MAVYLLHFPDPVGNTDNPRGMARHYLGWAKDSIERRLDQHVNGQGSPLVRAAVENGADVVIARTWPEGNRTFERRLKNRKNSPKLCPICQEVH